MIKTRRVPSEGPDSFVYISPRAVVTGDVILGDDVSVWHGAVIRGDEARISIGDGSNVQDNAVLHCDPGIPLRIGSYVTIGHGAILHCAAIGDRCIVGMGSILLAGSVIGEDSLVAAGALIPPGKSFPPRSMLIGSPAKLVRELTSEEVERLRESALHYIQMARLSTSVRSYGE
jgi:carbonic anhydrase/acetyltransferase-like protein (isoleucine patch superfamily)